MLRELTTKLYHSHRHTVLRLSSGINALVGHTQSGKTAASMRPFRLLKDNRPRGGRFFSNFAGKKGTTVVEGIFADGQCVRVEKDIEKTRSGGKKVKETRYYVNDGEPYSDLSDEVIDALRLSELSCPDYWDQPLAVMPAGTFTRLVQRLTGIDRAFGWIKNINSRIRSTKKEKEIVLKDRDRLANELKELDDIEILEMITGGIESATKKIEKIEKDISSLTNYRQYLRRLNKQIEQFDGFEQLVKDIQSVEDLDAEIEETEKTIELLTRVVCLNEEIELTTKVIAKNERRYEQTLEELGICPFCGQTTHGRESCKEKRRAILH